MQGKRKQWTQDEKDILKNIYPTASWDEMIMLFGTSKNNIIHKAKQLGVQRQMVNFAKYKQEEIKFIKENYGKIPTKIIAEELGRTVCAIKTKARKLKCGTRTYWTGEEEEILKKVFPYYSNEEISEVFLEGRSESAIKNMARKMNLYKAELPPQKQKQFNKDELLEEIKKVYKRLGRTPLLTELRIYGLPSERTIARYFDGGYRKLCSELGWDWNYKVFGRDGLSKSINGDLCFSKAEKIITDFFITNNIPYSKKEESYKDVFKIEEFKTRRMDWLIYEKIPVEYFGCMGNYAYADKANKKIELCKKYNLPLIDIYPETLENLKEIFKEYIK